MTSRYEEVKDVKLLRVADVEEMLGLKRPRIYELAQTMPPGVVIKLGGRIRFDDDRLRAWLAAGGHLASAR